MIWCLDMIWYTQFGGNSKIPGTATLIAGHISISKIPGTAALNRNSHYQVLASQDGHQHWVSKAFSTNTGFKSIETKCFLKVLKLSCTLKPINFQKLSDAMSSQSSETYMLVRSSPPKGWQFFVVPPQPLVNILAFWIWFQSNQSSVYIFYDGNWLNLWWRTSPRAVARTVGNVVVRSKCSPLPYISYLSRIRLGLQSIVPLNPNSPAFV